MKLAARPSSDLDWNIEGDVKRFEWDLGLQDPYFPLEDELYFQALGLALSHFTKNVFPKHPHAEAVLYRGSLDFSFFFRWSEKQEENFAVWKEGRKEVNERHLKRLFCLEAFVAYFQMLAHKLPDEMPLILSLDCSDIDSVAEMLHLLSPERLEHFTIETDLSFSSSTGVCIPTDLACSQEVLDRLDALFHSLESFKPVYEAYLSEQWDGLDEIIVLPGTLTEQGRRKLKGFEAAGGVVREF